MRPAVIAIAIAAALAGPVHARDGIVLEAYTGARPPDAERTLAPLLAELATRGFIAGDGVGRIFDAKVSRPRSDALPADFVERLKRGHGAWVSGKFDEAVQLLGPMIDAAHASSGAFARNPPLRDKLPDALIALALSQHRRGDPRSARSTFGELVRSFPDVQVARATYGPEAAGLFDQAKKELSDTPRGRLLVKLTDEAADVFVNERFVQKGTTVKDLLPGEYRVVVQVGSKQSRSHRVTIASGADATVAIDLVFDATLHSSPGWAGFEFTTADEREKSELGHALSVATSIGERSVIVVGIDDVKGRRAVVGALISTTNEQAIRRASIPLESGPSADQLRALGRFLAGGEKPSTGIDVEIGGPEPARPTIPGEGPRRWGGWPFITGGVAVAAIGAGVYLFAVDGTCPDGSTDPNCPDVYSTKTPAIAALSAGAVFAGITIYLIATRPGDPPRTAYVAPTNGGAVAGVSLRF